MKEVTSLITLGADVNFRYDAVRHCVVNLYVKSSVSLIYTYLSSQKFYKTTPLMIALVEDEPQVVPLLIEAGAEVNIQDEV